jgi:hypothetical protein
MLRILARRLWLLPLVALAFTVLACEKEVEVNYLFLTSDPFIVDPGTHKDFPFSVTPEMTAIPGYEDNVSLYYRFAIFSLDTLSLYVLTDDNYYAFTQHLPFTSLREHHGITDADNWIHNMARGDYHLVFDNTDASSDRKVNNSSIKIQYFGYE